MNDINIKIKFSNGAEELYAAAGGIGPEAATSGSAGFDLRVNYIGDGEEVCSILPGGRAAVHSGISVEPSRSDVAGFVYSRSGLGAVQGLTVAQGVGLIDPDYRGEIVVFLLNTSGETKTVKRGDRVAQLVFQPFYRAVFEKAEELGSTGRGAGGFGHTGK